MAKNNTNASGYVVAVGEPELTPVTLTSTDGSFLTALYEAIDCRTVDVISLTEDIDLWVDDEALLIAEPQPNEGLSLMLLAFGRPYQPVFGNGVFLSTDSEGSTVGLSNRQKRVVENAFKQAVMM